ARRLEGPAQARLVLAEAHRLAERLQTRTARLSVALADARLADASADPAGALRALRASASEVRPGDAWAEWEVEALTARAFARTNQLDSAVAAGRRAVAAVERVRGNLGSTTLRSIVVAQRAAVYGDLVLALLAQGRADEAFTVADAARSRSLIEHLGEARGERGVPRQAVEADALLRRIDYLLQQLRDTEQPGRAERGAAEDHLATQLESELATARDRYEGLVARRSDGEAATGGLLGLTAPRLDDVRAALRPGEVLLAYLLTDSVVVTFVVRRDGLNVVRAHVTKETIGHQVRLVRDLWSRPGSDWQRAMPAATALYRTLVQPAEDAGLLRDATRLVVVPHGVLGQVPFAALPHPLSGEFLVRRYVVTTLPLSSGLSALRSRSVDISSQAHALAIAPFPDELPASREEAEAVTVARLQVRVRHGASATEAMVRRALGQGSVVHLATHGVLNARNPMFSRVELARGSGRTADDGRLEVHELFGLVIQSPLVFFSGCETGAEAGWSDDPSQHGGELSLAQATLTAGAANVISTLWRIDDAGAASFAGRFYRGLVGRLLTDAFAEAQRGLATDVRYVSPYYWAGYLFSGQDGQLGPQTGGPRSVSSSTPTDVRRPSRR
ncbi:MAG TPA: CHAT domain-containing protein, partial [Gemmatimonadales bacterium]